MSCANPTGRVNATALPHAPGAPGAPGQTPYTLQPFQFSDWPQARAMLLAGYPQTPVRLWDAGFARLQAVPPGGAQTLGTLMREGQRVVGVALTFCSRRGDGHDQPWHVNGSSLTIAPEARSHALWMVRNTMPDPATVYTILTPIAATSRIVQRIGFKPISHQSILGMTPRLLGGAGAKVPVLGGDQALAALRDHPLAQALADHHRLGCLVSALLTEAGPVPLVWRAKRRFRWLPVAELVYAPSQSQVAAHVGALARHLLGRGFPLFEFEAQQDLAVDFACTRLFQRRFARGPYPARGIDHLYSELIYLHR